MSKSINPYDIKLKPVPTATYTPTYRNSITRRQSSYSLCVQMICSCTSTDLYLVVKMIPNQLLVRFLQKYFWVYLIREILNHGLKLSSCNIKLKARKEKTQLWKCNWRLKRSFSTLQPRTFFLLRMHHKADQWYQYAYSTTGVIM